MPRRTRTLASPAVPALLGLLAAAAATRGRLVRAALLSLGACSMKLSAGAVPLLWLLAEGLAPWRPRPRPAALARGFVALALGVAAVVAYTVALYGALDPYGADNLRVLQHRVGLAPVLAASLQIHLGYLQQFVAPFGLSPEYPDFAASLTDPATLLSGAALLALAAYAAWGARRRPLVALAILGALALALPTSNLLPMPNMRADRFTYLPSVPACLGIAALLLAATVPAGVATRHVYIQSLPAGSVPSCGATLDYMLEVFPLLTVVRKVLTGGGECARIDWTFLGLSMPAWVLISVVVLAIFGVVANLRFPRAR